MRDMGDSLRSSLGKPGIAPSLCVPSLMAYAADKYKNESLASLFGSGHHFPVDHQVYTQYYTYFFMLARAHRWKDSLDAWSTARRLSPNGAASAQMAPLAAFITQKVAVDGCISCAAALSSILDSVTLENGRDVEVCSSVSGNIDSLDRSLLDHVKHIRSSF